LIVIGRRYGRRAGRCRSFRFLLSPTVRQRAELIGLLGWQRELYNAALEERRGTWRWERRSVSYFDQCRTLSTLREVRPEVLASRVTVCRGTLRRLDLAFAGFYRRCRSGQRPGYPRFRSQTRWDALQWEERKGWRLDEAARRLHLMGIGAIKMRLHRTIRGTPKAITVRREGEYQACGHAAHADTKVAINILRAGRAQQQNAA
jgi:putative transposase